MRVAPISCHKTPISFFCYKMNVYRKTDVIEVLMLKKRFKNGYFFIFSIIRSQNMNVRSILRCNKILLFLT